jgi:hypothetical protein
MVSAEQCRAHSAEYAARGMEPNVSVQRANILTAMSRSWATLAKQTDRDEALVKEEGRRPPQEPAFSSSARSALLRSASAPVLTSCGSLPELPHD